MKKHILVLAITALTSIGMLSGCETGTGPGGDSLVNFHTGYEGLKLESVKPSANGKITKPTINDTSYNVYGYYLDQSFEVPFDFDKVVGETTDIYVKVLKGAGSESNPYEIESGLSLNALTHFGEEIKAHAKLTKDFEVLSLYTSLYETTIFNGVFNGNGHTISLASEGNDTGLFYKVGEEGSLSNFTLVGNIVGSHSSTGAVTNFNYGEISNITTIGTEYHKTNGCSNGVSLMTTFDEEDKSIVVNDFGTLGILDTLEKGGAGAISGTNHGLIKDCLNKMRVSATIGAGSMAGINHGRIESCFNQGPIGASGNNAVNSTQIRDPEYSFSYIGGMAGANYGEIHQCANLNQVFVARLPWLYNENPAGQDDFSNRIRVGGIAGYNYSKYNKDTKTFDGGIITECVNYGRVHGDMQVGGIAGYSNGYIADCFFSGLIGGRNSVASIVGWQPGDKEGDYPGLVTNCIGLSRVVTGSESTVYDENENTFVTTKLTNKDKNGDSNISDYYRIAKYASHSIYHSYSGNKSPIDYDALVNGENVTNTSDSSKATMDESAYKVVGFKNDEETNIWYYESTNDTTAMVGIHTSWQVYLNTRLAWQNKTITVKLASGDVVINGIAGIDYINTSLVTSGTDTAPTYKSDWNANLSAPIPGRGLPTETGLTIGNNQKLIWVTTQNDASTMWDGLLIDNITLYPMVVAM